MHQALELLAELGDDDIRWLFDNGVERSAISGTELVTEDVVPESLFFILDGLVEIRLQSVPSQPVAVLGPGQVFGEVSFLDSSPASATVRALENSTLLEVHCATLRDELERSASFAMRIYRALAVLQARKLRESTRREWAGQSSEIAGTEVEQLLDAELDGVKTALLEADKAAQRNGDAVPAELLEQLSAGMTAFGYRLDELIGDRSGLPESTRALLGHKAQRDLLPYIMMSELGERMYAKPRGYAGDFETIDIMYRDQPTGVGRLGPALDVCFRNQPANRAVMNRRGLLAEEIGRSIGAAAAGETVHVTSLASGPAAELFDVFGYLEDPGRLKASCIDIDFQALGFVSAAAQQAGLTGRFDLHHGNLVYLAMGRKQLELPPQDLMYSIGLIDYFADKFVRKLLDWVYDRLKPGGRVILGNFVDTNSNKAMMDYLFEWKLIHRSEADMNRLFESSKFGRPCTSIRYEPEGVNLFAECVKEA